MAYRDDKLNTPTKRERIRAVISRGREHAERRAAQAAAARKRRVRGKHHKATRKAWKKEI